MPYVVIYQNILHQKVVVVYNNIQNCLDACKKYLKSINIYDEEFQNDINEASSIGELIILISSYAIEEIEIHKAWDMDAKELK